MSDTSLKEPRLLDLHPEPADMRAEVLAGLRRSPKRIPSKFFYDERGSALFDSICDLQEYYPTRTELAITRERAPEIAELCGPRALLVEYGSGSSLKTRVLLDALEDPAAYVPIDISRDHLTSTARRLAADYPALEVLPVCADYTNALPLPTLEGTVGRRVAYFPGSTIGNFLPTAARLFLRRIAETLGQGGGLLIGVDLVKDRETLEAAYDDAAGVTAAFNLNLLARVNREIEADFDLTAFRHRAIYRDRPEEGIPDADSLAPGGLGRIEMWLVSQKQQVLTVSGERFPIEREEAILTEYSYKYTLEAFAELAAEASLDVARAWTDDANQFSVQYLVAR